MNAAAAKGIALLWCVLALWNSPHAAAAWLQLGDSQVQDGVVYVPVIFDPGPDAVASLQFDVPFESRRFFFLHAEPGPAALSAGKDVLPGVRQAKVTVVIAGLNQNAIGAGVVAGLYFELIPEGKGEARIALENHILSDPRGNAVAHQRPREAGDAGREQPRNAPDEAPADTGNASNAPEGGADSGAEDASATSDALASNDQNSDPRFGRFGPEGVFGDAPAGDSANPAAMNPPSERSEGPEADKTARHSPVAVPQVVMPEQMPIVPARPADAREQHGQPRVYHSDRSAPTPDEAASTPGKESTALSFGQVDDGETSMPMSRERLAAIRAARMQESAPALESDAHGLARTTAPSRPLPLGAMVFTGLAALALLALALRRVGIWGAGRRSIRT